MSKNEVKNVEQETKEVKRGDHIMRMRPGKDAALYTPGADITYNIKGLLGGVIKNMFTEECNEGDPRLLMARDLAYFTKCAEMKDATWEEAGITQLDNIFDQMNPKDATEFLYRFFLATMDYYWHSIRLAPESLCIQPKEMEKACNISEVLRTMPKEMREEYLDHLKTYNILPDIFFEGALYDRVRKEIKDDKK